VYQERFHTFHHHTSSTHHFIHYSFFDLTRLSYHTLLYYITYNIEMEKAKAAVSDFMSKSGHHDTTVHETVAPAVQNEVVKPHVHEEINTAIDKEVHQDHYHRTIQPVKDREVLPETHTAKLGAVQHREFDHRDHENTKRSLATEQAQFKDQRVVQETSHSQSANAVVGGEHVHHVRLYLLPSSFALTNTC
jgi:hypothetical protein